MITTEPKKIEDLLEVLSDKIARAILIQTLDKECSALQISQELDIPLATVYRKLKRLQDTGMEQHVKTIINLQGNEEKFYRCAIHEVKVNFSLEGVLVQLKMEDYSDKFIRLWKRLKYSNDTDIGPTTMG